MIAQIGRNDPCPCGSGKKFKKCCLRKRQASETQITAESLKDASDKAVALLVKHSAKTCGEGGYLQAKDLFGVDDIEDEKSPNHALFQIFMGWFLFNWHPEDQDKGLSVSFPNKNTVVARFLKEQAHKADNITRMFLQAAQKEPFCYWQVIAVEPGKGTLLKNMITEEERFVQDIASSNIFKKWDITLAQIVGVDDCFIFNGLVPYVLPPGRFRPIVEELLKIVRRDAPNKNISSVDLLGFDLDFFVHYLACFNELLNPTLPEIRNKDGDKLTFTTSIYSFNPDNKAEVIEKLQSMKSIEHDGGPKPWFIWFGFGSKVKGTIKVLEDSIETECNSTRRNKELRKRLEKGLKVLIEYQNTKEKPFELNETPSMPGRESNALDLNTLPPEAKKEIESMMEQQHMKWVDEKIPMLNNKTPRETVKTKEGKKKVSEMINDWENMQTRNPNPQFQFDFNKLRAELGLELE